MKKSLIFASLFISAGVLSADDWPQWLGPNRDGYWRETGIVEKLPPEGPKVLWRVNCGMGYAGPAVSKGKIYLPDRVLATDAKNPDNPFARGAVRGTDRLLCLDEKNGKELWKFEYPCEYTVSYASGPRCTPTVDGDMVYWLGTMGDFYALNSNSGKVVWEKHFIKDYEAELPVWGFAAHPLVDGDKVICLVGGAGGKGVVAFDKKTGKELWHSLTTRGDPGYCPPVIFEVNGKRILVQWHSAAVAAIDPETGKKLWEYPWQIMAALTAPVPRLVDGKYLFMTGFYNGSLLLDISGAAPVVVWKSKSKVNQSSVMPENTVDLHSIMPTPLIKDGYIYGVCSYGELRCLELMNGNRVWMTHQPTSGKSSRWGNAFLIPNGENIFIFNEQGQLIIAKFTPKGYEEISRAKILEATNKYALGRSVVWSHPAFANGTMYARNDKELVAVDLKK